MSVTKPAEADSMRVPPVLPRLRVQIDTGSGLTVTLDQEPYEIPTEYGTGRTSVRRIIDDLTDRLGPIRVEIVESDGSTFTDIATPSPLATEDPDAQSEPSSAFELTGAGFLADEPVALAVIVSHHHADTSGVARVHLPPALLEQHQNDLVLIGGTSAATTTARPR